jgi:hypothetical protein
LYLDNLASLTSFSMVASANIVIEDCRSCKIRYHSVLRNTVLTYVHTCKLVSSNFKFTCLSMESVFRFCLKYVSHLFFLMGSVCSRRSHVAFQTYRQLPSRVRLQAQRRWAWAIRRILLLIRLRRIWASLGTYLRNHQTTVLFGHLRARHGTFTYTGSGRGSSSRSSR